MSVDSLSAQAQQAVQQSSDQDLKSLQAKVGVLQKGTPGKRAAEEKKLKEACEGFESIFIKQLWKEMRATVPKEDMLHSREEEQWKDMLDDEMSKKMASEGGIGLKDVLFAQLKDKLTKVARGMPGEPIATQSVRPLRSPDGLPLQTNAVKPLAEATRPVRGLAPVPAADAGATPAASTPAGRSVQVGQPAEQVGQAAGQTTSQTTGQAEGGDPLSRVNALISRIELERTGRPGPGLAVGQPDQTSQPGQAGEAALPTASGSTPPQAVQAQTAHVQAAGAQTVQGQAGHAPAVQPQVAQVQSVQSEPREAALPAAKPAAKDLETLSRLGLELMRGNLVGAVSLGKATDES